MSLQITLSFLDYWVELTLGMIVRFVFIFTGGHIDLCTGQCLAWIDLPRRISIEVGTEATPVVWMRTLYVQHLYRGILLVVKKGK